MVGFEQGALKEDLLLRELDLLDSNGDKKTLCLSLSQQMMICIYTSWDADHTQIKSVVARYSTGSGIKSEFLVPRVRDIITALYVHGFIINNIYGDGATENWSTFKELVDRTVKGVF